MSELMDNDKLSAWSPLDDGPFCAYHENGKIANEGNIYNGKLNGLLTTYNINGDKITEYIYLNDKKFAQIIGALIVVIK